MVELAIDLTDAPTQEAERVITEGLDDFNAEQAGYRDWRSLAVLARRPGSGEVVGGLLGRTSLGLLFIHLVFLPPEARGQRLGTRILQMTEAEALRRGCRSAVLYTISFQAPGFYERHGWRELGRVPCDPEGTYRVVMTKMLAPASRPEVGSND
jgi:GNAT superfamily N-acetyltransferase